jgi:hypothetical protein
VPVSGLQFLPTDTPGVDALKRTGNRRPIGFFRPDNYGIRPNDGMTEDDSSEESCCHELTDSINEG